MPSAVIKGMLAAIGITIVWKQLPVAFGVDRRTARTSRPDCIPARPLIAALSLAILYGWKYTPLARSSCCRRRSSWWWLPASLAAVARERAGLALTASHFVNVPLGGLGALYGALPRPDFARVRQPGGLDRRRHHRHRRQHRDAAVAAGVDRLDPLKRHSPPDRELLAQGTANAVSGFLGGLPVTAVIVRSGANVAAGGRERLSALVHGVLLLVAVVFAGPLLNMIPLACLAAVLIQVGLNLCKPALFSTQVKLGVTQLLPFALTIAAVLALDLLKGVIVGILVGIGFVLYENSKRAVVAERDAEACWRMRFRRDGTFVSKPGIVSALDEVDDGEDSGHRRHRRVHRPRRQGSAGHLHRRRAPPQHHGHRSSAST